MSSAPTGSTAGAQPVAALSAGRTQRLRSARIAASLLVVHGLIEMTGLLFAGAAANALQAFGSLQGEQLAANAVTIALFGGLWGAARWVAAWGVWSLHKWALALGGLLCLATIISALTIIPAGVADTALALPALIALLWAWFGNERVAVGPRPDHPFE